MVAPDADPIRIGVIGCGGRGTGAARDALTASENVTLVAMGDIFPDRLASARAEQFGKMAATNADSPPQYKVTPTNDCFTGIDAYQKVLAADMRPRDPRHAARVPPEHLEAAIAAGKHVFMEKPVCVDVAGALSVIESSEARGVEASASCAGTQRRHDPRYMRDDQADPRRRHRRRDLGRRCTGTRAALWNLTRKPEWSDTEWQLRNWLYFTWALG